MIRYREIMTQRQPEMIQLLGMVADLGWHFNPAAIATMVRWVASGHSWEPGKTRGLMPFLNKDQFSPATIAAMVKWVISGDDEGAMRVFLEHNVRVILFPPHMTHVLQPVDICWAGQFKAKMGDAWNPYLRKQGVEDAPSWNWTRTRERLRRTTEVGCACCSPSTKRHKRSRSRHSHPRGSVRRDSCLGTSVV